MLARNATKLFQEIDKIREEHPDVREVLINWESNPDYDSVVGKYDLCTYVPWMVEYEGIYFDDEDDLRDYMYHYELVEEDKLDDAVAEMESFDCIVIYSK